MYVYKLIYTRRMTIKVIDVENYYSRRIYVSLLTAHQVGVSKLQCWLHFFNLKSFKFSEKCRTYMISFSIHNTENIYKNRITAGNVTL